MKNDQPAAIGQQVAMARVQAGMSVRALAAASGIAPANISKLETGKYNASVAVLERILQPLGCRLAVVKA